MSTAVNQTPMPTRHTLRQFFAELMQPEVVIGDGITAPARTTSLVGVYVTRKLATSALVITDLDAAARLGSCMAEVPPTAVKEALAARALTPVMSRNFYTLLDNLARVFNTEGAPEVSLYEMYEPNSVIPSDVAALTGSIGRRMDVKLGIHGYGTGQMSLIVR